MGVAEDRWRKATIKDGRTTLFGRDMTREPDNSVVRVLTADNPKKRTPTSPNRKTPREHFAYLLDAQKSGRPLTVGEYRHKIGVTQANGDLAWNLNKDYIALDRAGARSSSSATQSTKHEIQPVRSPSANQKHHAQEEARRRNAPPPTEGARRGIMQMRRGDAYVYWFRLVINGKIVGHKIGWAFDWRQRLRQFNSVSLLALGGLEYKVKTFQKFDTARLAFRVEQTLLRKFDELRHPSNREVLTRVNTEKIKEVWDSLVVAAMLGQPLL
jgi:hypothetical protein